MLYSGFVAGVIGVFLQVQPTGGTGPTKPVLDPVLTLYQTGDGWQAVEWSCRSPEMAGWVITRTSPLLDRPERVLVLDPAARMAVIPYLKGSTFSIHNVRNWSDENKIVEVR